MNQIPFDGDIGRKGHQRKINARSTKKASLHRGHCFTIIKGLYEKVINVRQIQTYKHVKMFPRLWRQGARLTRIP